jgi:REP element-mobilizing transposase RayT
MAHTFTNLLFHVVFSTKDRVASMSADLRSPLHAYLGGIVRNLQGSAREINGTADHVHLLARIPASLSVSDLVRTLKSNSAKWVHERQSRRLFAWQEGYSAFSVSHSNAAAVADYIARQEEHHRKISFQQELLLYLKKHNIEYDERFLWG